MTTITPHARPRPMFWASGGSIVMRMATGCFAIDAEQAADLLGLFDDERKAALANPNGTDSDAWIAAMEKHNELSVARAEAGRWARASGCLSDIQRRDAA